MCTVLSLNNKKDFLVGRNMDIEYDLHQSIIITPRNYIWKMKSSWNIKDPSSREMKGKAIIGVGILSPDKFPLYFEGMNEMGLAMASLNFPNSGYFFEPAANKNNIAPHELIPWVLSQYSNLDELKRDIHNLNVVQIDYSPQMKTHPQHFIVWYKNESIVIESTRKGLQIFENPLGVLTNNPTFDWHMENLKQYQNLTPTQSYDVKWFDYKLLPFGQGIGAFGLPGDMSPASRFIKTAFLKAHSTNLDDELELVSHIFHILDAVGMTKGSVVTKENIDDITLYSSCMNTTNGYYYWKSYNNNQISCVKFFNEDLSGNTPILFNFQIKQVIKELN